MKALNKFTTSWFFSDIPAFLKFTTIFVKGDILVLLPLLILIFLTSFISFKLMFILLGSYISVRYFGEMIYWLLQQFGPRRHRPEDFGLKNLDNHAVYILYQTLAIFWVVVGIGIVAATILYLQ